MKKEEIERLEKILKQATPQQVIKLQMELEAVLEYLYEIFYSSHNHIQFHARVAGEPFYLKVIKPLEKILDWKEERKQQVKEKIMRERQQTEGLASKEKWDKISGAVKIGGGIVAATSLIGGLAYYLSKKKNNKNAGK